MAHHLNFQTVYDSGGLWPLLLLRKSTAGSCLGETLNSKSLWNQHKDEAYTLSAIFIADPRLEGREKWHYRTIPTTIRVLQSPSPQLNARRKQTKISWRLSMSRVTLQSSLDFDHDDFMFANTISL